MKILLTISVLFMGVAGSLADDAPPIPPKESPKENSLSIQTLSGRLYDGVKINRIEPDGLLITHSGGVAKVNFPDLPEAIQKQYGFDPEKAAQFAKNRQAEMVRFRILQQERIQLAKQTEMEKATAAAKEQEEMAMAQKNRANLEFMQKPYISSKQVKDYFQSQFSGPGTRNRRNFDLLMSGGYDDYAIQYAIEYNLELAGKKGDHKAMLDFQTALTEHGKVVAAKEQNQINAEQNAQMLFEMQQLRQSLQGIDRNLSGIRRGF